LQEDELPADASARRRRARYSALAGIGAFIVSMVMFASIPCDESGLGWQGWIGLVAGIAVPLLAGVATSLAWRRIGLLAALPVMVIVTALVFAIDFSIWWNDSC
jgi:hypothetical protein